MLLVACDYDGTLAPITNDPQAAHPVHASILALRSLAMLPDTHVAVISGRALRDLAELSRLPAEVCLVGSHGAEFDAGFAEGLSSDVRGRILAIQHQVAQIGVGIPGSFAEAKPAGAAFHYRGVESHLVASVVDSVLNGPGSLRGVYVTHGKYVVEISAIPTNKGNALQHVREQVGATAVTFVGDDLTDESAFAALSGSDLGVKVGEGKTLATMRIADTDEVGRFLASMLVARRAWMKSNPANDVGPLTSSQQRQLDEVIARNRVVGRFP